MELCVSPQMNFIQGVFTLAITVLMAWEYVFRGRFATVAFFRKQRITIIEYIFIDLSSLPWKLVALTFSSDQDGLTDLSTGNDKGTLALKAAEQDSDQRND